MAILPGVADPDTVKLAASMVAGYTKAAPDFAVRVRIDGRVPVESIHVLPLKGDPVKALMIG